MADPAYEQGNSMFNLFPDSFGTTSGVHVFPFQRVSRAALNQSDWPLPFDKALTVVDVPNFACSCQWRSAWKHQDTLYSSGLLPSQPRIIFPGVIPQNLLGSLV